MKSGHLGVSARGHVYDDRVEEPQACVECCASARESALRLMAASTISMPKRCQQHESVGKVSTPAAACAASNQRGGPKPRRQASPIPCSPTRWEAAGTQGAACSDTSLARTGFLPQRRSVLRRWYHHS
eukprot:2174403-Rhodomonas_salina.1